jgi:hypothetical protein
MFRCTCSAVASYLGFGTCFGCCGANAIFGVLYPSKSGQINNHTVKHTVEQCFVFGALDCLVIGD